jgi:hypothetical protein
MFSKACFFCFGLWEYWLRQALKVLLIQNSSNFSLTLKFTPFVLAIDLEQGVKLQFCRTKPLPAGISAGKDGYKFYLAEQGGAYKEHDPFP